ncbi:hypothetical protein QOT17_019563 [Balamuthia mandrillaris]
MLRKITGGSKVLQPNRKKKDVNIKEKKKKKQKKQKEITTTSTQQEVNKKKQHRSKRRKPCPERPGWWTVTSHKKYFATKGQVGVVVTYRGVQLPNSFETLESNAILSSASLSCPLFSHLFFIVLTQFK